MPGAELATSLTVSEADRLLQAEALVREFCRWHIAPLRTSVEVTVDGSGAQILQLPTMRLAAVTGIVEDGVAVATSDVQWTEAGYLWRATPWTSRLRGVTVTIDHGYETVPSEVRAIVQAVAQRAVDNPGSRPRAQVGPFADSFSQVGFNQAPALALLDAEKLTLARYALPGLP